MSTTVRLVPAEKKWSYRIREMHADFALILLFLGVAVPWLGYRRVRRLMQVDSTTTVERLALYASTIAFQWAAAAVIIWRTTKHHLPLDQLGVAVPDRGLTAFVSLGLSLLVLANQGLAIRRLAAGSPEAKSLLPQLALKIFPQTGVEQLAFGALVATVAVCEEFIYRGFIQRVFQDAGQGIALVGVFVSAAFFSLAHAYQGRRGLLSTFAVGVLFASVRWWTASLVPSMSAHFVADLTVGLFAPKRLRQSVRLE